MAKRKGIVSLRLTLEEAIELRAAADNGYGDGDFYQHEQGLEPVFLSGMKKLEDLIAAASTYRIQRPHSRDGGTK